MFKRLGMIFITCVLFNIGYGYSQEIWVGKDGNIRNTDTRAILVDGDELYLATRNELYRGTDTKDRWEAIFSLPAGENEITCIGGSTDNILVGTRRGLFRSQDYGKSWRNVFKTIIPDKNDILSIETSRYNTKRVLIGTRRGVFISEDSGTRWQDISANIKNRSVSCVALNKESIYVCGEAGLYFKKDSSVGWERLFVQNAPEKSADVEESSDKSAEIEEGNNRIVNCIAIKNKRLYIGLNKRILYSDDEGKSWNVFPQEGLKGRINYILTSSKSDKFYCATTKGIFEFAKDKAKWLELYKGIDKAVAVNCVKFCNKNEDSLWAITDRGLYRLESGKYILDQYIDVERNIKTLKIMFSNEPSFRELQQAAMKFAELDPDKIKNWRTQARLKSLLPKVNIGLDKNSSTNYEIYTSATRDYVAVGPEDMTNGMDVSISWELGDLIWSDDQTNIDVRSRLTTQLRNDILDDLRRAYYERKRLQFELITAPPKDIKGRFDKELRIQELAQAIDDLTGNYLSEHIKS